MSKRNKPVPDVVNECSKPAPSYTVAAEAWDQINREKRECSVRQVKALIRKDEALRAEKKKVQEAIRQINTTGEPLEYSVIDLLLPNCIY